MKSPSLPAELKCLLPRWNETDKQALCAAHKRLEALGPQALDQLLEFVRFRVWRAQWLGKLWAFSYLLWPLLLVLNQYYDRPSRGFTPLGSSLLLCFLIWAGAGVSYFSQFNSLTFCNVCKALATFEDARVISVLAHAAIIARGSGNSHIIDGCVGEAINKLLDSGRTHEMHFTLEERKALSRLIVPSMPLQAAAATRLLLRIEDASALARVRKVAQKSSVWEANEAAREYLTHFAPSDALLHTNAPPPSLSYSADIPHSPEMQEVLACVMQLGSRSETERHSAMTILRYMGKEQLRLVLQLLQHSHPSEQRIDRFIRTSLTLSLALLGSSYFWFLHIPYLDPAAVRLTAGCFSIAGGAFGWLLGSEIVYYLRNRRRARLLGSRKGIFPEKRLLEALGTLENVAVVGLLIDTLPSSPIFNGAELANALKTSLLTLLPRLQTSDATLLNKQQRAILNHELGRSKLAFAAWWTSYKVVGQQVAYDLAILKAWEQVGDEHALPVVKRLAAQTSTNSAYKQVQAAAQECLPYLEARTGQLRSAQTLLRAAATPTKTGEVLLRAAIAPAPALVTRGEVQQLLRATQPGSIDQNQPSG